MKKKRTLALCMVVLLVVLMASGCKKQVGTPEDNAVSEADKKTDENEEVVVHKYGFSGIDMENPYYITLVKSLRESITEEGSTLITEDPQGDSQKQVEQIQGMIKEGIELLFLSPVDWQKITPALKELKEANVKIVNVDTQVKNMEYIDAYIGADNKNAGFVCGEDLTKRYPKGGKIVILECPTMNSINDRITGFEEAIAEKGFEVVRREDTHGDMQESMVDAEKIFTENTDIVAVMCGNDPTALGALVAAKEQKNFQAVIYGVDGSPDIKQELKKPNSAVVGTGAQAPIEIGKRAAKIGLQILNGETYEKETYVETFLITGENVDMYGVDGWQ